MNMTLRTRVIYDARMFDVLPGDVLIWNTKNDERSNMISHDLVISFHISDEIVTVCSFNSLGCIRQMIWSGLTWIPLIFRTFDT